MTPAEKIAQLYGVWVGADRGGDGVAPHQHDSPRRADDWDELIRDGLGQLTRPFGTAPVEPAHGAAALAAHPGADRRRRAASASRRSSTRSA